MMSLAEGILVANVYKPERACYLQHGVSLVPLLSVVDGDRHSLVESPAGESVEVRHLSGFREYV